MIICSHCQRQRYYFIVLASMWINNSDIYVDDKDILR